ncbi:MAG: hypothetical protein VB875_09810, partial [Pirellulales bacterium]
MFYAIRSTAGGPSGLTRKQGVTVSTLIRLRFGVFWVVTLIVGIACGDETPNDNSTTGGPNFAELIADLDSPQFAVRRRAARALTEAGHRALPALAEATFSKQPQRRKSTFGILLALSRSNDPKTRAGTLEVLQRLARSETAAVAARAAEILRFPQRRAFSVLQGIGVDFSKRGSLDFKKAAFKHDDLKHLAMLDSDP